MLKFMIILLAFFGVSAAAQETKFRDWTVFVGRDKVTLKDVAMLLLIPKGVKRSMVRDLLWVSTVTQFILVMWPY